MRKHSNWVTILAAIVLMAVALAAPVSAHHGWSEYQDESIFPMFNQHELSSYNAIGEVAYVQSKSQLASDYIRSSKSPNAKAVKDLLYARLNHAWHLVCQ